MSIVSLILLSALGFTACAEAPPEKFDRSSLKTTDYNSNVASGNTEAQKVEVPVPIPAVTPAATPAVTPPAAPPVVVAPANPVPEVKTVSEADMFKFLAAAPFTVEGLPKDKSDIYIHEMKIKADPLITHFSYKVAKPADCKVAGGYKVEPIATVVKIDVEKLADGAVAVCLLRFLAPGKLWQKTENASALTWEKIPFVRTIKSQYVEYDEDCRKDIITTTVVKFSGNKGTYTWVRDPKSQGCKSQTLQSGEDNLSITSSDLVEIKGFWAYEGEEASGWYAFKWKNKERTSFEGVYGYGDPSLSSVGPWSSVSP